MVPTVIEKHAKEVTETIKGGDYDEEQLEEVQNWCRFTLRFSEVERKKRAARQITSAIQRHSPAARLRWLLDGVFYYEAERWWAQVCYNKEHDARYIDEIAECNAELEGIRAELEELKRWAPEAIVEAWVEITR